MRPVCKALRTVLIPLSRLMGSSNFIIRNMNFYNQHGNFCIVQANGVHRVLGILIIDAKEVLWEVIVSKDEVEEVDEYFLFADYKKKKVLERLVRSELTTRRH